MTGTRLLTTSLYTFAAALMLVPFALTTGCKPAQTDGVKPPIIDMHLHAKNAPKPGRSSPTRLCVPVTAYGLTDPNCDKPLEAPATDEAKPWKVPA